MFFKCSSTQTQPHPLPPRTSALSHIPKLIGSGGFEESLSRPSPGLGIAEDAGVSCHQKPLQARQDIDSCADRLRESIGGDKPM